MGMRAAFPLAAMSLIEADRDLARRSLYEFVRIAWEHVETTPYVDNWHIRTVCKALEDMSEGRTRRKVVNIPPGFTKTLLTGVFWPAWDWIKNPWRRWTYLSFDISLLNNAARKLVTLLQSEWYRVRWGAKLRMSRFAISDFWTTEGGNRFNTSFRGKGTGRHSHIQVIDDPIKPNDAANSENLDFVWHALAETFANRAVNIDTFARLMIMQRIHEDDPAARAIAQGWDLLCLPMEYDPGEGDPEDLRTSRGELLFPERFPADAIERLKIELGPDVYETQYQQNPSIPGGQIIHEDWIDKYTIGVEDLPTDFRSIQSWDLAFKDNASSDYVAGQPWRHAMRDGRSHYFLPFEPFADRRSFVGTVAEMRIKRPLWPCSKILVEDKANGPACESVLRDEWPGVIELVDPKGSKIGRMHSVAHIFADGRVHLVRGPWVDRLKKVWTRFPKVKKDDEADAASQALRYLSKDERKLEALARVAATMRR